MDQVNNEHTIAVARGSTVRRACAGCDRTRRVRPHIATTHAVLLPTFLFVKLMLYLLQHKKLIGTVQWCPGWRSLVCTKRLIVM